MEKPNQGLGDKIIFYDGVCNLCAWSVRFVLKHDKNEVFSFASLQSEFAEVILKDKFDRSPNLNSFVLLAEDSIYTRSDAVLEVLKSLGGIWKLLLIFIVFPKPIRDWVYDFVAKNRYKWFGKKDICIVPSPQIRNRFLD